MKRILLLFSCFTVIFYASGQDPEIEKIKQELKKHPQQDTFRVNRLNALANPRMLTAEETEKLATEALSISRKTSYTMGEGYALIYLAYAKLLMRNRGEAIRLTQQADSIVTRLNNQELLANVLLNMGSIYQNNDNKKALDYSLKAEKTAAKTNNKILLSNCQYRISAIYQISLSDFQKSMEYALKSISSAEEAHSLECLSRGWATLATVYNTVGDQQNALLYYQKAAEANNKLGNKIQERVLHNNIGERYRLMGKYGEAINEYHRALEGEADPYKIELTESNLADVYVRVNSLPLAFHYGFKSLTMAKAIDDIEGISWIDGILSRAYLEKKMADSAVHYGLLGLGAAKQVGTIEYMRDNAGALADAYAFKRDFANAYNYHMQYINYRDSMLNAEITNKTQVLQYNSDLSKKQTQITVLNQQKKAQQNFLISALIVLLLIIITAVALLRNNRQKQKANELLRKQKHEIEDQRDQTNKALAELQQTQKQLIQSEKMASLGELTAGIAHEIQNPLNFVNNFSEINKELLLEMKNEIEKGNLIEAKSMANDVIDNEEKINRHGKRADAIVKGMLQHSRVSTGQKELTDINAFTDEYFRLSYHGMRAKDKSFNAALQTDFDTGIGKIKIVPQDMGRVLFNLFNNAFYSIMHKKNLISFENLSGLNSYEPTVSVCTKKIDDKILISVKDNGIGIPQKVVDKIFQPFFTTKPTGQGTGLGLSLSYDIIKAHGGEIRVDTNEGEGAEFLIQLPIK